MFAEWEGWNYLDSVYFCVISLTKIGFGDLVPGTSDHDSTMHEVKLVINFVYILLGMAIVAMCYYLLREEVTVKLTQFEDKMKDKVFVFKQKVNVKKWLIFTNEKFFAFPHHVHDPPNLKKVQILIQRNIAIDVISKPPSKTRATTSTCFVIVFEKDKPVSIVRWKNTKNQRKNVCISIICRRHFTSHSLRKTQYCGIYCWRSRDWRSRVFWEYFNQNSKYWQVSILEQYFTSF